MINYQRIPMIAAANLTDDQVARLINSDWMRDEAPRIAEEKEWPIDRAINLVCQRLVEDCGSLSEYIDELVAYR